MYNESMNEFIWICGIVPDDINHQIRQICLKENKELHLSERFFRTNLHISMKRTFHCEEFENMKEDLKQLLTDEKAIYCGYTHLIKVKDMLWLTMDEDARIRQVHQRIDELLKNKYSVPIDTFDKNYLPHITIFHKGDPQNLIRMYEKLLDVLPSKPINISRYAIGSKIKGNDIFSV